MTRDETPVPAAPTPKTYAQIRAIHGCNAVEVYDELTAPPLTVVQYGGVWSVVTGHRLPLIPDTAGVDVLIAEVRQEMTP